MKKGERKKVAAAFSTLLPEAWQKAGNSFMRRHRDWVQCINFNPSRWSDDYEVLNGFEFLKKPGIPTCGCLPQSLLNPNQTQRWMASARIANPASNDYAPKVFNEMVRQFEPSILQPLRLDDIKILLGNELTYWPHAYALCVMAAEAGNKAEAERFYQAFLDATADKPYDWASQARHELETCLREMGSESLRARLAAIEAEKMRSLKLAV